MTTSGHARSGPSNRDPALARPHPRLGLPVPRYHGASIANLPSTLFNALGVTPGPGPSMLAPLEPKLDPFGGRRAQGTIVVGLIDGFGWYPFSRWAAGPSPRGARWQRCAVPLTSVFPTTTTTALTSLSTGCGPATHGLVGYRQYLPGFGCVADMLRMSPVGTEAAGSLIGPQWRPEHISGAPTIYRRGISAVALSRWQFQHTGFTRLLYDGAEYVPYSTATDLAEGLRLLLERPRPPPVIYTYWDELDSIQHVRGPSPELFDLEMERIANLLEYVARRLPSTTRRSTTVLLTGDHGQVPATLKARIAVESFPELTRLMARPLAGDRRAGLFSAAEGQIGELEAALRGVLPAGSQILSVAEAVRLGLFGPPPHHPELRERLGDLLALVPSPAGLTYQSPGRPAPDRFLFGAHGGLEPEELLVPLVAGTLDELAGADGTERRGQKP